MLNRLIVLLGAFFKACEVKEMPKDKTFLSESH